MESLSAPAPRGYSEPVVGPVGSGCNFSLGYLGLGLRKVWHWQGGTKDMRMNKKDNSW